MEKFDIPVVMFIFKRAEKSKTIMQRIGTVKPTKVYIIADAGRNDEEKALVEECRRAVEDAITWDCEVIKNYADTNKGCFDRIGLGARWVLEREPWAIFLEDDNLPEYTFFQYCKELLERYKENDKILWICGTNYLKQYLPKDGSDYMFTKHMLPCGWASWSSKFLKYYDAYFTLFYDRDTMKRIKKGYENKKYFKYNYSCWKDEVSRYESYGKYISWDYQMGFSIRAHDLYGISPKFNQIRNIGVDNYSIHGGTSMDSIMTSRFCENETFAMPSPLKAPETVAVDDEFERLTEEIILPPSSLIKTIILKIMWFFIRLLRKTSWGTALVNKVIPKRFLT